jgi:DNA-binding CsgD family transcriptional regulator
MDNLPPYVKSHICFSHHADIIDICKPLKRLGLYGFIFTRYYHDGTFIDLSTNLQWSACFFNKYFNAAYLKKDIYDDMFRLDAPYLSVLHKDNQVWTDAEKYFQLGNGITMGKSFENYYEVCCFYSDSNNNQINDFYLANIDILQSFIDYFKEKSQPIIQKGLCNKLTIPNAYIDQTAYSASGNVDAFLKDINIFVPEKNRSLTMREIACIRLCAQGKTSQVIGGLLYLSSRTVEKHLDNAKKKMSCKSLCELIYLATKTHQL